MVPDYVHELWLVGASSNDLSYPLQDFDQWIKENLRDSSFIYLDEGYTHPNHEAIHLDDFIKHRRFDLNNFETSGPTVTLVLREDRFWLAYPWMQWIYRIFLRWNQPSWLSRILSQWQNRVVHKLIHMIRQEYPDSQIHLTGIGRTGRYPESVSDLRTTSVNEAVEHQWCAIYAKSHVIIGIHGSNMLIPSALSAGFIEILPQEKIRHQAETTLLPYGNRLSLFLGRTLPQFTKPALVARHVRSMIHDFPYVYKNLKESSS
jgi:hypothetical protein